MNLKAELFCDSRCELGEGPFWHPLLDRLFWFDILNCTLLSANDQGHIVDRITFKDFVSAAAVIDKDTLAVVQAGALLRYDFRTDQSTTIIDIEPDVPGNRSNDSRVDRTGGFWIGTMSRRGGGDTGAGAVYRFKGGVLEPLIDDITIPNSICFSPDGKIAYFADTMTSKILSCPTDPDTGLPIGAWTEFASTVGRGGPDGAVVDAAGYLWSARWGASCVVRHAPDGSVDKIVELPVSQPSCPAFGGKDYKTMFITTAREHMTPEQLEKEPTAGSVYAIELDVPGLPEPLIKL